MPSPKAVEVYEKIAPIGVKYPMATMRMVCEATGYTKSDLVNTFTQYKTSWCKITGWDNYRRREYLNQHKNFSIPESARPGFEIEAWCTRRLRPMKHTKIEYSRGIAA